MKFIKRFFDGIQRDFRLFVFILLLLEVYRGLFILMMSGYMGSDAGSGQIAAAMFTGLRLSLKTAGAVTLLSFVFVTLAGFTPRLRLVIGILASFVFSVLFMARFPYYREFHSTFGLEVVQGLNDDIGSIFVMIVREYGFFWRFPVAFILTIICIAILSRFLILKTFSPPNLDGFFRKAGFVTALVLFVGAFGLFARFGGSFTYGNGVNWENAGVTNDDFLNECILDDAQALYRARALEKRMADGEVTGVDKENVLAAAQIISRQKNVTGNDLTPYLEKKTKGAKIKMPKHIFVILGETWMQWPMLGKYSDLHVADGIKSLIAEPDCYYSRNFMPNGDFTSVAITGMITGLPDINIRVNYRPKTFEEVYITSPAQYFHALGYKVDFWYGGTPGWDNISKTATSQGFDNFYGFPDYQAPKQNTWGTKDKNLFDALERHLAEEPPTVHLIMTTTNHPPYNLNLAEEGFDLDACIKELEKLPNIEDAKSLAIELGHYRYMDKCATEFVKNVSASFPDSLFVITGDHAVRTDPGTKPTIFEHQSVPFVLYGAGVKKNILPADVVGGHISVFPTIIELIAPKDFVYRSIAPPLTESNGVAFNRDVFITQNAAGKIDSDAVELLPHVASAELNKVNLTNEQANAKKIIGAMRTVAWQILTRGLQVAEK